MTRAALGLLLAVSLGAPVRAQGSAEAVRIGVLTDESGPYAGSAGLGSVLAAQMAAEDFGGSVRQRAIEIVHADTGNQPEQAAAIARRWFESERVNAIVDLPTTPVAHAVQAVAREKSRTVMITAAASSEFTARLCSPISTHWADDSHALAAGTVRAALAQGDESWFFVTQDQEFGLALEREATAVLQAGGGRVVGTVRRQAGAAEAEALQQADASGAKAIGLAGVGPDVAALVTAARELGMPREGAVLAGFLIDIGEVHAMGLPAGQGLLFTSGYYWDQDEPSRAFARRFLARHGAMPGKDHAMVYTAVTQFLRAIEAVGSDDAIAVNRAMRERPFTVFGKKASIRGDGRVLFDMTVWRVKAPGQSREDWDYYELVRTIPAAEAFLPANREACGG